MVKCVIHCSDSPQGRGTDAKNIHRWHLENGWDGIGYHYVILEDGTIQNGRPEYWKGSHTRGYNNALGICLIGKDSFTEAQYFSLFNLIASKGFSKEEVKGHYELDSKKTCPNFDVPAWLDTIM